VCVRYSAESNNAAWREIDGEVVLMRLKDGVVFSLAETGAFIWSLVEQGPRSQEDIIKALCDEFEVDEATASGDVAKFLADLVTAGLVSECEDAEKRDAAGGG